MTILFLGNLSLAHGRNAVSTRLQDKSHWAYTHTARPTELKKNIKRYFNEDDDVVERRSNTLRRLNRRNNPEIQNKMLIDDYSDTELTDLQDFKEDEIDNKHELQRLLEDLKNDKELTNEAIDITRGRKGRRRKLSSHEQGLLLVETLKKKKNYTNLDDHRGHGGHLQSGIMDMLGRSMSLVYFK